MLFAFLFLAAQVATDVVKDAQPYVEPAVSTLAKTIIGSLLVISWVITSLAVWVAYKAQEARIAAMQALNEKAFTLTEKSTTTLSAFTTTLEGLKESDRSGHVIIQGMKSSFDLFVATQAYRRHSPPSGIPITRDPRGGGGNR